MTEKAYSKLTIARTQLDTALRLYEEGDDLFSVVTLAGAAEEVLGGLLQQVAEERGYGRSPRALDTLVDATMRVYRVLLGEELERRNLVHQANRVRNRLKHHSLDDSRHLEMDLEEAAKSMLQRAVNNYWRLTKERTSAMKRFEDGHG